MLELLKESLKKSPIVDKKGYKYFVHPITDGFPYLDPEILREITDVVADIIGDRDFDYIVGAEAMAIPLGVALSLKLNKPFVVIRKRQYGLPGEVEVTQETGYSKNRLYINGIKEGDSVVIVDDVLSTGGTIKALASAFDRMNVKIEDIIIVIEKGPNKARVEEEIGHKIKTLVRVDVVDDHVEILE